MKRDLKKDFEAFILNVPDDMWHTHNSSTAFRFHGMVRTGEVSLGGDDLDGTADVCCADSRGQGEVKGKLCKHGARRTR
jgi:hypothetical protein